MVIQPSVVHDRPLPFWLKCYELPGAGWCVAPAKLLLVVGGRRLRASAMRSVKRAVIASRNCRFARMGGRSALVLRILLGWSHRSQRKIYEVTLPWCHLEVCPQRMPKPLLLRSGSRFQRLGDPSRQAVASSRLYNLVLLRHYSTN